MTSHTSDIRSVLVLDPGFAQSAGHHYTYNTILRQGFAERGPATRFLFDHRLPPDLSAEFPGGLGAFTGNFYATTAETGNAGSEEVRHRAELFAADLARISAANPDLAVDASTLVFGHSLDAVSFLGIALWRATLPEARRPRLALNAMLGITDTPLCRDHYSLSTALFRGDEGVRLFGGSKAGAAMLSALSGSPCSMLPTPLPDFPDEFFSRPSGHPVFGMVGDGRGGKNLHILPPAILRYLAAGGQGTFHLNLTPTETGCHPAFLALHDLSREYPDRVRLNLDHLRQEEYYRLLAGFSVLLIPYNPAVYHRFRPSGPAIEAAALGLPAITCDGGFMRDELEGDNGSIFVRDLSPKTLASALHMFEAERAERTAKAASFARMYCKLHGVDAVMAALLG